MQKIKHVHFDMCKRAYMPVFTSVITPPKYQAAQETWNSTYRIENKEKQFKKQEQINRALINTFDNTIKYDDALSRQIFTSEQQGQVKKRSFKSRCINIKTNN